MKGKKLWHLQAREIVMLAVMIALCVVGNTICSHTVPLHAGTAITILSGISLGAGPGFIVGIVARFVCNFFDGQGPWTIWQMFSWGLLAAISGVCFQPVKRQTLLERQRKKKLSIVEVGRQARDSLMILLCMMVALLCGLLVVLLTGKSLDDMVGWRLYAWGGVGLLMGVFFKKKKLVVHPLVMSVYTLCIVFIVYGGIMNFATLVMQHLVNKGENPMTLQALRALYITGVPYDLSHAIGAAICVFFVGESLLQKMERIQIKYNIFPKK